MSTPIARGRRDSTGYLALRTSESIASGSVVVLVNISTDTPYEATSEGGGWYSADVPAGTYALAAEGLTGMFPDLITGRSGLFQVPGGTQELGYKAEAFTLGAGQTVAAVRVAGGSVEYFQATDAGSNRWEATVVGPGKFEFQVVPDDILFS